MHCHARSPSAIWIMDWVVEYRAELWVMLHHHCEICLCMTERDSVGGDLCFCMGKRNILTFSMLGCRYINTSVCMRGHLNVEILYVLKLRQHPVKNRNKPEHHLSRFNCGVLCKSNRVEHRALASYFCSKNALSKVMRTLFEVAPAGKHSRRLCAPSPPKSLCSLLIAASQKAARWQF